MTELAVVRRPVEKMIQFYARLIPERSVTDWQDEEKCPRFSIRSLRNKRPERMGKS
ncbi:hypothetical protein MKZ91_26250 [Ensifer sp. MJa1]